MNGLILTTNMGYIKVGNNDYTPDGRKLSSRHVAFIPKGNGSYRLVASTDLYVDGLVVRGGKPLMWLFDGGYVSLDANGTPTSWNYYVADHLGSTRMVVESILLSRKKRK